MVIRHLVLSQRILSRCWTATGENYCGKSIFERRTLTNYGDLQHAKGTVLILPWLKAPKTAIKKYEDLYRRHGLEPLTYQANLKDFFFPKSGLNSSLMILNRLKNLTEHKDNSKIIIHSSSVGCYFYALMLWQMKKNPEAFARVHNAIAAQVCDSPVIGTLNEMAYGVGKMLNPKSDLISKLYRSICLMYFGLVTDTVSLYEELIATFKYDAPSVPSLICAAENDPMQIPEAYDDLCNAWRRKSLVIEKVWSNSRHAQNLRYYPEEYEQLITKLLEKSDIL